MKMFRLFLTAAIAVTTLVAGQPSITPDFEDDVTSEFPVGNKQQPYLTLNLVAEESVPLALRYTDAQCPLILGCCEEDCCGEGTSWQSGFCIVNPNSSGFDGTHSSSWNEGCVERVCCESDCCSPETEYDDGNAVCVPKGISPTNPKKHAECTSNEVCSSGYCYLGLGSPGTCSCNPETNIGCAEEYKCAGSKQLNEAQGIAFIVEPRPECRLLPFAACSPDDPGMCLTGVCDFETEACACNSMTNYPCDAENGETCVLLGNSYVCSNDPLGGKGPFEIGKPCIKNDDCVSGSCFYGFQIQGSPGTCSCNTDTNAGCVGEGKCAGPEDLMEAQFLADAASGCFLPHGATCDPSEDNCLSGVCDKTTLQCTCNTLSNWPCDTGSGEVCVLEGDSYACKIPPEISGGVN